MVLRTRSGRFFRRRRGGRKAHVRTMVVCVALMLVAMMAYAGFPSFRGEDKETLTRDFDTEAYVGAWGRHLGTNGTSIKQCSDLSDDDHLYKKCMCGKNKHQHKCAKVHCCSAELLPGSVHGECVTSFDLNGGIVIYSLILLYLFIVLAYVCDDYFCASLEGITERLKLSPDVAGATFMAAGSSAPELFVSLADNVITYPPKSLGVGTIVGSAIFNILVIIGLTACLSGQTLLIDWRPLVRDTAWYCLSIILLILSVFDREIQWYDALILLSGYVLYVITCAKWTALVKQLEAWRGLEVQGDEEEDGKEDRKERKTKEDTGGEKPTGDVESGEGTVKPEMVELEVATVEDEEDDTKKTDGTTSSNGKGAGADGEGDGAKEGDEGGYWDDLFDFPDAPLDRLWFIFCFPINLLLRLTIPDCTAERFQTDTGIGLCFGMSIVWIALVSHVLSFCAAKFGCIAGISTPVMGLTIMAAGTSIPDALSSVIVARQGEGDMAVANSIGSNVFDILMGLGFPYLISTLFVLKGPSPVITTDLVVSIGFLFGVVLVLFGCMAATGFRLYKEVGFFLITLYGLYIIFALAIQPLL